MPKMKTKRSAAKRFKIRSGGSIKRSQAFKRHILTKKTTRTNAICAELRRCTLRTSSMSARCSLTRKGEPPCHESNAA